LDAISGQKTISLHYQWVREILDMISPKESPLKHTQPYGEVHYCIHSRRNSFLGIWSTPGGSVGMVSEWGMRKCSGLFFLSGVPNSVLRNPNFNLFHGQVRDKNTLRITLNSIIYLTYRSLTLSAADQNIR
jgi:hypothetical protein